MCNEETSLNMPDVELIRFTVMLKYLKHNWRLLYKGCALFGIAYIGILIRVKHREQME